MYACPQMDLVLYAIRSPEAGTGYPLVPYPGVGEVRHGLASLGPFVEVTMDQKPVDRDDIKRFVKFAESADLATCGNVDALKQMAEGLATTLNVFENQIRKDLSKWRRIDAAYTEVAPQI